MTVSSIKHTQHSTRLSARYTRSQRDHVELASRDSSGGRWMAVGVHVLERQRASA